MSVILLGLNELNFEYVDRYIRLGKLPTFNKLIKNSGYIKTVSEKEYELLEPWIQWPTIHTGYDYSQHNIFRLGDIVNKDIEQIFEYLEKKNIKVGAISPFNASNKLVNPAFFVPDPWTNTKASGPYLLRYLAKAVRQAVNSNAEGKVTTTSIIVLLLSLLKYPRISAYKDYVNYLINSLTRKWYRPFILDRLLSDVFMHMWNKTKPGFSSLFLNSGAHIQHHYMFNSTVYDGIQMNPEWYINACDDPVLEIYNLYDKIIGNLLGIDPDIHIIIATGLHQEPYEKVEYYYRLKDHGNFLAKINIKYESIEPRMSRDFLVKFISEKDASHAENILSSIIDSNSNNVFSVDNRGNSIFVTLTYPYEINKDSVFYLNEAAYDNVVNDVAFVAIKNGHHNGIGYVLDSRTNYNNEKEIPLKEVHSRLINAVLGDVH